jgi:hypothetical protein
VAAISPKEMEIAKYKQRFKTADSRHESAFLYQIAAKNRYI